jgi:hypothetical protein
MKRSIINLSLFLLFLTALSANATCNYYDDFPWSVMIYGGPLNENNLLDVTNFEKGENSIYALEIAKQLDPCNVIRRYLQPLMTTVSFANTVAYIHDPNGPIYEWDPYLLFRWANYPWDRYITTTFGLGWGVSYDTRITVWEKHDSDNTKHLLNFLAFEATFAIPHYPQWQLALRLHHRSGVFGLYGADNAGSNYFTVGLRYNF